MWVSTHGDLLRTCDDVLRKSVHDLLCSDVQKISVSNLPLVKAICLPAFVDLRAEQRMPLSPKQNREQIFVL